MRVIWTFCFCCAIDNAEVEAVLADADQLHVRTAFLKEIRPEFVQFELDDLQTNAWSTTLGSIE
jgi:hypothetical protein